MNPNCLFVSLIISSFCQNEYRIIALWKYQKLNACKYTYYTFFNCVWWQICPCAEISCGIYTIYEKTPKNFSPNYLLFALHHNGLTSFLKWKWFFQADVSSKNRTNEFDFTTMIPQVDLFSFIFWKKFKTPKRHFEIN